MFTRFDLSIFSRRRSAKFALALLVGVVAITLGTFTASAYLIKSAPATQELTATQGQPPPTQIEAESITLLPRWFEPSQIARPEGIFLIAVDNRSGVHGPVFRLNRVAGGRLHEVRMAKGRLAWRHLVDLSPGDYVLTEATHPDLVCRITITPR